MENSKKGYWLLALVVIVIVVAGYLALKQEAGAPAGDLLGNENDPVLCTQDAMRCPDGTYVSRIPPTCEFAACDSSVAPNLEVPADWEK